MTTKKIDKLTPEQEVKIEAWKQKWLDVGRSTEPCERPKAEEAMTEVYKWMGFKQPKFVWLDSPIQVIEEPIKMENGGTLEGLSTEKIKEEKKKNLYNSFDGIRYFYWFPFYSVGELIADDINTPEDKHKIKVLTALFESSSWFLLFDEVCFFSERPTVLTIDTEGRLHNINGPSLAFKDGFGLYYYHGREMPEELINNHALITVDRIEKEQNAEVRRCLIEIYDQEHGVGQYILDSGAEKLHSDDFGTLYRKTLQGDEAMVFVQVTNSTPEPDGHYKDYMIRVHPELRPIANGQVVGERQEMTALNAIASTFGMTGKKYLGGFEEVKKAGLLDQS